MYVYMCILFHDLRARVSDSFYAIVLLALGASICGYLLLTFRLLTNCS